MVGFAIQMFIVYPIFLRCFSKVSAAMLFSAIAEATMVAFGTASSSATLPLTIACCEKRGISHKISSFVLEKDIKQLKIPERSIKPKPIKNGAAQTHKNTSFIFFNFKD